MFKFDSFTNDLPTNTPPDFNATNNSNSTPIIHINNLTINITPSQVVDCLKGIIQPKTYKQLPIKEKEIYYEKPRETWDDERDNINYTYNNCRACIMPNKRLTLDIKKSNKPSPLEKYRNKNIY